MMKLFTDKKDCCGCGACKDICHINAIQMIQDAEGFFYPCIDNHICVNCGECAEVCPIKSPDIRSCDRRYFGAQAKKESFRYSGSSGGIFPVIADYILSGQGVVYGAGYDSSMKVVHREVHDAVRLEQIKKTKYVQSDMTGIYRNIERRLKENRPVLFCGTPCQAYALRLFLKRPYEQLIIMDLVCYGVPSPGIWRDYVTYLEHKHNGKMTEFFFRDKRNRDNGHTCSYIIDGVEYAGSLYQNVYCRMYFTNHILRPTCHNCKFCTVKRDSDITIGDFWGIERIKPDIDDGMGTSLVILHTDRGKAIWDSVKQNINWFECRHEDIFQPRLSGPTEASENRQKFMQLYKEMSFEDLIEMKKAE